MHAQDSNLLDTSFGDSGVTNFAFYENDELATGVQFWAADKLDDNKILTFGITESGCAGSGAGAGAIVARFTENGQLDTSFNNGSGYKVFPGKYFISMKKAGENSYLLRSTNSRIDKLILGEYDINYATDFTTYSP